MKLTRRRGSLLTAAFLAILTACTPAPAPTPLAAPTSTPTAEAPETAQTIDTFDARVRARDGMTMVYVPAGQFEMGNNANERTRPVHAVAVDAFWIDQTEVTNAMFATFLSEQGNQVEDGVSWLEPGAGSRGIVYGHIEEVDGLFTPDSTTGLSSGPPWAATLPAPAGAARWTWPAISGSGCRTGGQRTTTRDRLPAIPRDRTRGPCAWPAAPPGSTRHTRTSPPVRCSHPRRIACTGWASAAPCGPGSSFTASWIWLLSHPPAVLSVLCGAFVDAKMG